MMKMTLLLTNKNPSSKNLYIRKRYIYNNIALEEVSRFLEYKGHGDEALSIGCTIDRIVPLKHAPARQKTVTTLDDHFTNNDRHIDLRDSSTPYSTTFNHSFNCS